MELTEFPEQTVVYAKHQSEYKPLPAHRYEDKAGRITCCWKLTWRERFKLLVTGRLWHDILTFDNALQPQLLSVDKPEMVNRKVTLRERL